MTGVLIEKGSLDADMHTGRMPCEDEGKDQGDVSTKQGTLKTASKPPEARTEAWDRFALKALRRHQPC